jgi:hypothetical protein
MLHMTAVRHVHFSFPKVAVTDAQGFLNHPVPNYDSCSGSQNNVTEVLFIKQSNVSRRNKNEALNKQQRDNLNLQKHFTAPIKPVQKGAVNTFPEY